MEDKQNSFSGWARVEVMGHQTHIGYVRTEAYGQAVMFRIDTPGLPEREYTLTEPAYVGGRWTQAGAVVKRDAWPDCSVMVGAGSIYRIMPCDEAAAMKAIEGSQRAELKLISLPEGMALPTPESESRDDSDMCQDCGHPEDGCVCGAAF